MLWTLVGNEGTRVDVTINKYSSEKCTPQSLLLENNYSHSTYLLVNKYSLPEIRLPLKLFDCGIFIINYFRSYYFPKEYVLPCKPLYWNKQKDSLKGVPLNRRS